MTASELVPFGDGIVARVHPGDKPAVLWIHGYTMDGRVFAPLMARLPEWRHVVIDLPGHGASRALGPDDTLASLGRRLGADALDAGVEHVAALSFGTMIGLQIAVAFPDRFASLLLAAPALAGGPVDADVGRRYEELARHHRQHGAGPELVERWMASPPDIFAGAARVPTVWQHLRGIVADHRWAELEDGYLHDLARHPQVSEDLGAVTARTTIVLGEHDLPSTVQAAAILAARLRSPRCRAIGGAGHLSLLEHPAVGAAVVREHLDPGSAP